MTATRAEPRFAEVSGPVVIDASVAVEYLVVLSFTSQAQTVFRAVLEQDLELWAPDLVYAESVSAVRRLVRLKALGATAAETAIEHLVRLPLAIAGTRSLVGRIWRLRNAMTPYDASYVALADALEAPIVTADGSLARAVMTRGGKAFFLGDLS